MKGHLFGCILLLLIAACGTPLSRTPPPGVPAEVSQPEIKVGDTWRYAVRDGFTSLPRPAVEYRVTQVQGDTVTVEVRTGDRVSTELYTRAGNWLRRPATNMQEFSYSPPYEAFEFPLVAGKTWRSRSSATDPADGRSFPVRISGTVLGWERIRVPAGEFDALKVRRHVFLDYWQSKVKGQCIIEENEWYAPALGKVAKRETTSRYLNGIYTHAADGIVRTGNDGRDDDPPRYIQDDWLVYELVSYNAR
jgi:hypothetical protein